MRVHHDAQFFSVKLFETFSPKCGQFKTEVQDIFPKDNFPSDFFLINEAIHSALSMRAKESSSEYSLSPSELGHHLDMSRLGFLGFLE